MIEWIVSSSILIAAVLLLRLIFRNKISKVLQYAMWGLVVLRLLIPGSIAESAASIGNLLSSFTEKPIVQAASGDLTAETSYDFAVEEILSAHDYPREVYSALPEDRQEALVQAYQPEIRQKLDAYEKAYDTAQLVKNLWLAGCGLMGAFLLMANLQFLWRLKRSRQKLDTGASLPVYQTAAVQTPCLFGLFRPAVYLPDAAIDERAMAYILAHEQTHYRHLDHIWAAVRCVCLVLHWYNPLVWIAVKVSRADSELACDESTLARLGDSSRESYGRTLIEMSCAKPSMADYLLTATTMTGDKRNLYQRIQAIAKKPRFLLTAVITLAVIAVVIVGCTFTGAKNSGSVSVGPSNDGVISDDPSGPPILTADEPIPWPLPAPAPYEFTYEEYFATEWYHRGAYPNLSTSIITPNGVYTPHCKDGKLLVRRSYQKETKDIFRVGSEIYTNLLILGTDDIWFYCIEDGREFFRIDPYGEKEILFIDERGKLPKNGEYNISSRVCFFDDHQVILFVAGHADGYGVYRLHLTSLTADVMGTAAECPLLRNPISNHQIAWSVGNTNYTSPSPFLSSTTPQETEPQETIPETIPDALVRMMGMLYILDEEEGSLVQQLPTGYLYLGHCFEDKEKIPRWNKESCNIPSYTEFYASLDDPDYIYYRTEAGYQRMIRAALVEDTYSDGDPDNTAPADYEIAFFNTLLRGASGNIYNQATGMEYNQPEGVNLHWLFYNGFPEWEQYHVPLTEAEKAFLAAHGWGDEMPMGNAHRFPISAMDQQLRKYFGITYAQSWKAGTDTIGDYREENQCYYRWVSDMRGFSVTVESVESNAAKTVYYITHTCDDYTGNTYRMTLIKTPGLFQIYSNVVVAQGKP